NLTLLGGRHLATMRELVPGLVSLYFPKIPIAKTWPYTSMEEAVKAFDGMDALKQEGFVVCDGDFNRVKLKHPGYVTLHALKGGMSRRSIVEVVRQGEVSEVESAFPEFKELLEGTRERYEALVARCELEYSSIEHIESQ